MITFSYTPLGTTAVVNLVLLDSDRFWPAEWGHDSEGVVQVSQPIRGKSQTPYGRGNIVVPIRFTTRRVFPNLVSAWRHAFIEIPKTNGQNGTLLIQVPGGGQFRSSPCACKSSPCRLNGIEVTTSWQFIGAQLK